MEDDRPIGMFDSGIGGLTVMQHVIKAMPNENIIYLGDTARLPYGPKSRETIIRYSIENTVLLLQRQVKMIVVACNTSSAHALETLQDIFRIPIIGVIQPGAENAVETSSTGRIAVLGTKGTIDSHSYQKEILKKDPIAFITAIACPLFVPLVEENYLNHPATALIIKEYLKPIKENRVDTLLLGCTHYPLLIKAIQNEAGKEVKIVDSATCCAKKVSELLSSHQAIRNKKTPPYYHYIVSDEPQKFKTLGGSFLGRTIENVEKIFCS